MASVKVKFRSSTIKGQPGRIYYQILQRRKPRQLSTPYKVFPSEWDENRSQIVVPFCSSRQFLIMSIQESISVEVERLKEIIRKFDLKGVQYNAEDVIEEFRNYKYNYSFFHYMEKIIIRLKHKAQIRTSEAYCSALSSFKKFRRNEDIMLDCLTSDIMEEYEAWLKQKGLIPNSISFYTRILRAVYNRAINDGIIENCHPFRKVYTGVDKTIKRALPLFMIKEIVRLDLSETPALDFARDMFIMSFYLRGMSFIDMAYLKKNDLKNGRLTYRRRKTGQQLIIGWEPEMQNILDKYPENSTDYLLPIITRPTESERNVYRNRCSTINRNLKAIATKIGLSEPLTMYVARHSWASGANAKGIPINVIREGMGHNSEATTRIYLSELNSAVVDRANKLILKCLKE